MRPVGALLCEHRNDRSIDEGADSHAPAPRRALRISDRLHIDEYVLTVLRPLVDHPNSQRSVPDPLQHLQRSVPDPLQHLQRSVPDPLQRVGPALHNPWHRHWTVIDGRGPHPGLAKHRAAALPVDGETDRPDLRPNRIRWRLTRNDPSGRPAVDLAVNLHWHFGAQRNGVMYVPHAWIDVPICAFGSQLAVDLFVDVLPPRLVGATAVLPVRLNGTVVAPGGTEAFDWRLALRGDGSTTAWTSNAH